MRGAGIRLTRQPDPHGKKVQRRVRATAGTLFLAKSVSARGVRKPSGTLKNPPAIPETPIKIQWNRAGRTKHAGGDKRAHWHRLNPPHFPMPTQLWGATNGLAGTASTPLFLCTHTHTHTHRSHELGATNGLCGTISTPLFPVHPWGATNGLSGTVSTPAIRALARENSENVSRHTAEDAALWHAPKAQCASTA